MPAYNEGPRIFDNIIETVHTMEEICPSYELIVVDDGSKDNTNKEAQRAAARYANVKAVRYTNNGGKGNALKYGFRHATGDLVVFLDADLDLHPRQIKTFLDYMQRSNADVVIGSKRHKLSQLDYPMKRRVLSAGYSLFIKALFNLSVKDTQTGLKLFKRQVLEEVFPKVLVKRYAFDLELLVNVRHRGYNIVEAPITLSFQRGKGRFGRIGFEEIKPIAIDTAAIFYRLRFLKYYDSPENNERTISVDSHSAENAE
jgi:glycosyltransferase involved in cell wall biosynthesis